MEACHNVSASKSGTTNSSTHSWRLAERERPVAPEDSRIAHILELTLGLVTLICVGIACCRARQRIDARRAKKLAAGEEFSSESSIGPEELEFESEEEEDEEEEEEDYEEEDQGKKNITLPKNGLLEAHSSSPLLFLKQFKWISVLHFFPRR